jgi:hypothetical protein
MSEPTYVPVKKIRNFKIRAIETVYSLHKGTNMVLEDTENVILDDVLFKGATSELAAFEAMKQIEKEGKCDMTNLKVTVHPFPG